MNKKIYIFDTTLRDGEQTPRVSLNTDEKLKIAKQLERTGVDVIEAGFPVASKGDFEAVKAIAQNIKGPVIVGLSRALKKDIDTAWQALKYSQNPRIHTFIATSDIHMKYKLKMTPEEVLNKAYEMVKYAKSLCPSVEFSPEDATRTNREFLYKVVEKVIEAGADVVNIPDTVGYTTPGEYGSLIKGIRENVKNIDKVIISVHCHNDLGLAVANSLAAIENGAQQIECAVNGLGERAGNAAMEEIVMAIKTRSDYFKCITSIDTTQIIGTSKLVSNLTGVRVQNNKAIVGVNAFAHEAGIHQHGVLACSQTYEIMTPESVGLTKNSMVLGKHSGRHAFNQRLKEMGYDISPEKLNEAFAKFKNMADRKKYISDEDIEELVKEEIFEIPETYKLQYFQISSGNNTVPTSTVKVNFNGRAIDEAACGHNPIDATFKAIEKATGASIKLKEYSLKAVGSGKDTCGEVNLKIENNEKIFSAKGMGMDVVEASAIALINAINKMHYYMCIA